VLSIKKEPTMLVRLLYVSQPVGPITTTVTTSILEKSNTYNKRENITGVLCQGSGLWMQVLEGERHQVNILYARILANRHHHHIELLSMEEITHRRFGQWSMALVRLSKDDPMVKMAHPEFDPYTATSQDALSLLDELIKTSTPIVPMES
jgi:Sensors of blue-light using FAD